MTNQAAVSDSYIVRKIIQALYQKGVTPTAEELLETIEGMKNTVQDLGTEISGLRAHDAVKAVHGWVEVEMCTGCGATYSLDQLAVIAPRAVSCCPERDMQRTLVPANYGSVTQAATGNFIEQVASALHCHGMFSNYPQILTALHDVLDNSQAKSKEILELERERNGLQRTLDLVNAELDSVAKLLGVTDVYGIRPAIDAMRDRCRVQDETASEGLAPKTVFLPVGLDMATADLIGSFAENLGQRLNYKQRQGYSGWSRDDWQDDCLRRLHTSDKPLDVAAFAVFAWYHDWSGSYEGEISELTTGEAVFNAGGQPVNVTVNVTLPDLSEQIRLALMQNMGMKKDQEGPIGFRTE